MDTAEKTVAEQVHDMVRESLYDENEIVNDTTPDDAVLVNGITRDFGFHPQRLEAQRAGVKRVIAQLPDEFTKGGGWSFLNLCVLRDGTQWGEQSTCEALVVLAMGLGLAHYCMEREMWDALPGGVPYVRFDGEPS